MFLRTNSLVIERSHITNVHLKIIRWELNVLWVHIGFSTVHSFLASKRMLATYVRRMRNSNRETLSPAKIPAIFVFDEIIFQ